jgi:hypothetical protein
MDLVKPENSKLIDILKGSGKIDIAKPFSHEIFLIEAHIAGTTHIDNMEEIEGEIEIGKRINFYREPNNPHDNRAIVVKDKNDNKLGYVPRDKNEMLSRLMDAGKLLYGIVKTKEKLDEWVKITIEIYLKD